MEGEDDDDEDKDEEDTAARLLVLTHGPECEVGVYKVPQLRFGFQINLSCPVLSPAPPPLSSLLGQNIKLWRGEGNIMTVSVGQYHLPYNIKANVKNQVGWGEGDGNFGEEIQNSK